MTEEHKAKLKALAAERKATKATSVTETPESEYEREINLTKEKDIELRKDLASKGIRSQNVNMTSALEVGSEPHYVYLRIKKGYEKRPTNIRFTPQRHYNQKGDIVREDFPLVDRYGIPVDCVTMDVAQLMLDITQESDRLLYENAKNNKPYYLDRLSDPMYYFVDKEEEAEETISDFEKSYEAGKVIFEKTTPELREFARLFSMNTDGMSDIRVKAEMMEKCTKNPKEVIKIENDPNRPLMEILRKAEHRKVISKKHGVWKWGDTIMGSTYDEAVAWMKNNSDLVTFIEKQANEK